MSAIFSDYEPTLGLALQRTEGQKVVRTIDIANIKAHVARIDDDYDLIFETPAGFLSMARYISGIKIKQGERFQTWGDTIEFKELETERDVFFCMHEIGHYVYSHLLQDEKQRGDSEDRVGPAMLFSAIMTKEIPDVVFCDDYRRFVSGIDAIVGDKGVSTFYESFIERNRLEQVASIWAITVFKNELGVDDKGMGRAVAAYEFAWESYDGVFTWLYPISEKGRNISHEEYQLMRQSFDYGLEIAAIYYKMGWLKPQLGESDFWLLKSNLEGQVFNFRSTKSGFPLVEMEKERGSGLISTVTTSLFETVLVEFKDGNLTEMHDSTQSATTFSVDVTRKVIGAQKLILEELSDIERSKDADDLSTLDAIKRYFGSEFDPADIIMFQKGKHNMAKNKVQLILEEPGVRLDLARGLMRDKLIRSYKVPDDIISLDMMDKEACFRCFEWVTKNIFGKEWEWDYSNGDLYEGMYIREFGEMQDEWIQKKGKGE